MRKKSTVAVAVISVVAALLIPIIGPFTFYGAVVPFLAPVLPRPAGVPKSASAAYHWKGFGLIWEWDQPLPSGCARWRAAKTLDYYGVQLVIGQDGCDSAGLPLSHASYADHVVFGEGGDRVGGERCPFTVSGAQIAAHKRLLQEAKEIATPELELRALRRIERRLRSVNGGSLTTDATGGCNDLNLTDYGSP